MDIEPGYRVQRRHPDGFWRDVTGNGGFSHCRDLAIDAAMDLEEQGETVQVVNERGAVVWT